MNLFCSTVDWLWHLPTVKLYLKKPMWSPCMEQLVAYQHSEQIKQQSEKVSKLIFLPNAVFSYSYMFVPGGILASVLLFLCLYLSVLVLLGGLSGSLSALTQRTLLYAESTAKYVSMYSNHGRSQKGLIFTQRRSAIFWSHFITEAPVSLASFHLTYGQCFDKWGTRHSLSLVCSSPTSFLPRLT